MSDSNTGGRTSPSASSPSTERSSLLNQPSLKAAYGTDISRSDSEYGISENSSLLSRSGDEEASIDSNDVPTEVDRLQPLSSRAILWIVLPMLLGQSRSGSPKL